MHFEILIEDESGRIALKPLLEKILGPYGSPHTWTMHSYKGIGKLPADLAEKSDPRKRILLANLPRLLRGYGRTYSNTPGVCVIVIVDLDDKNCKTFKRELMDLLKQCQPQPRTLFRIAIEETEAWLMGDKAAVLRAYPRVRKPILYSYVQDSICNTWETLADAVHPGGASALKKLGWPHSAIAKYRWAERIAPLIDVEKNESKSFQVFRDGLRRLAGILAP